MPTSVWFGIKITNISNGYKTDELRKIFKEFGRLRSLTFLKPNSFHKKGKKRGQQILVTYRSKGDAERVIDSKGTLYKTHYFIIRNRSAINFISKRSPINPSDSKVKSINALNDDCLFGIFCHFTKRELIQLERVCKRWRKICYSVMAREKNLCLKKEFFTTNLVGITKIILTYDAEEKFRFRYLNRLLSRCGTNLVMLDVTSMFIKDGVALAKVLAVIGKYCKNLQTLHVPSCQDINCDLEEANILWQLKVLHLHGEFLHHYDLEKEINTIFKKAVQLEELYIWCEIVHCYMRLFPDNRSVILNFHKRPKTLKKFIIPYRFFRWIDCIKSRLTDWESGSLCEIQTNYRFARIKFDPDKTSYYIKFLRPDIDSDDDDES